MPKCRGRNNNRKAAHAAWMKNLRQTEKAIAEGHETKRSKWWATVDRKYRKK